MSNKSNPIDFDRTAVRVSNVSITGNIILSIGKLITGIVGHSSAMVSDAIHSATDVFSSIIVIIGVKIASKDADKEHPYGHERLETVAAVILSVILAITGIFIGHTAIEKLTNGTYETIIVPSISAVIAAVISIISKEAMFHYTKHWAKIIDSGALMADAWHHRSDALSSIGSLIGVVGARMGYIWADPLASLIICVFILKAAYDIFVEAIKKMIDQSCDENTEQAIKACAEKNENIIKVGSIHTREFGNRIYCDITVIADGNIKLNESSKIAKDIHDSIEKEFPKIKHITVVMRGGNADNNQ